MTDQDPTQPYQAPPMAPPAPPEAPTQATAPEAAAPSPMAPPAPPASEAVTPAPTVPVAAPAAPARAGGSRLKWIVAGVITLLVAGTAAAATFMLTREAGEPEVLAWTPADSVVYTEARLDLPGSQEAELAEVMSAFPGFDDQAAFQTKLNEALDQLVKQASDDEMSYTGDIEPWFGGQVSVSVGPLPQQADPEQVRALLLASVKDAAKAEAWAKDLLAESGATTSTEDYNGVTITTVTPPAGSIEIAARMEGAYALFGPVIGIGDPTSIKAAIDTKGTDGLPTNEQFGTAAASVSGDRLAFAYVDSGAITKGAAGLAGAAAEAMPSLPAVFDELAAPWMVAAVRAQDGAFVVDTRSPHVDALGPAEKAKSVLPSYLPPTTVAFVGGHDLGGSLQRLKDFAAKDPELADGIKQVDDALAIVGGFDAVAGWMGEAGLAVSRDGDAVGGGLLIAPTDAEAADRLLTQLRGFLSLAGGSSGIKVSDEAYNGETITVIDLGDIGSLAGGMTGGVVPSVDGNVSIAYAVTDDVVVLGVGTDFVKAVLDARSSGDSLATAQRFKDALARVDEEHGSLAWLDIAGIRDLVEAQVPADERSQYEADAKPYLEAFDTLIATQTPGDDVDSGTLVITVRSN